MGSSLCVSRFAKRLLAFLAMGIVLVIALLTSRDSVAVEENGSAARNHIFLPTRQATESIFAQAFIVEAEVDLQTEAQLQFVEELGLACDGLGTCELEMSEQDVLVLQDAEIPVNMTARALKLTVKNTSDVVAQSDTFETGSRYDDLAISDWDERSYNINITGAPSGMVVSDVVYSTRIVHTYPGELWLQLAWNEPDWMETIWPQLGGTDDGGYDDDPEYDDDIELIDRALPTQFDGLDVNAMWGILAEDFTTSGNSGWFDYLELYIYYVLNDDFDHALPINSLPYFNSQDYSGATRAPDDPNPSCDDVGGTVWYRYTASESGLVRFQVGELGGEWLAIFTGTRGSLTEVACDRHSGTDGWTSRIDLPVTAGATYHIMIGPDDSDEGYMEIEASPLQVTCDAISEIPRSECDGLQAFYDSTNGNIGDDWFTSTTPCSWLDIECTGGHVTRINDDDHYVGGSIPPEIEKLAYLEYFRLDDVSIGGDLPSEIGNLSNLQDLRIYFNALTGSIPTDLGNLTNLDTLRLGNNQLSGQLPRELMNLDLSLFWFANNDLCEPGDVAFQEWLDSIPSVHSTDVICALSPPTLFQISNPDEDGTYVVAWSPLADADDYQLQEQFNGGAWLSIYRGVDTSVTRHDRAGGEWCYRVRATNTGGDSDWSNVACATVEDTPPETPTLLAPGNGSTVNTNAPIFDWTSPSDATQYQIQVDDDSVFASPVIDATPSNSSYTPDIPLANETYYWRVRARDAVGNWSGWSNVWSVTIHIGDTCSMPASPNLLAPIDGSMTDDGTPTFDWDDEPNSSEYHILVDNDASFSNPEIDTIQSGSAYTPGTALVDHTYYWRVRGHNASSGCDAYGPWSEVWSVTIDSGPSLPAIPILNAISNNDGDGDYTISWSTAAGAASYELQERFENSIWNTIYSGPGTSQSRSERTNGQWCYRVRALNASGTGEWSATECALVSTGVDLEPRAYLPLVLKQHIYLQ